MRQIVRKLMPVFFLLASAGWAQTVYNPGNAGGSLPSGTQFNALANSSGSTSYATSPALWFVDQSAASDFSTKLQAALAGAHSFNATGDEIVAQGFSTTQTASASFWGATTPNAGIIQLPFGAISTNVPQVVPNNSTGLIAGHYRLQGGNGQGAAASNNSSVLQSTSGTFPTGASGESGTASALSTAGTGQSLTITGATPFTSANIGCIVEAPSGSGGGLATNSSWGMISGITSTSVVTLNYVTKNGSGNSGGSTWDMICPVLATDTGNFTGSVFGVGVEDTNLSAANVAGAIPYMDLNSQESTYLSRVSISGFTDVGAYLGIGDFGPLAGLNFGTGSSANANTIPLVDRVANGGRGTIQDFSITSGSPSTKPAINIDAERFAALYMSGHMEDATTAGLCFGCAPTLNISVPSKGNYNAHGSTSIAMHGTSTATAGSLIDIGSGQKAITAIGTAAVTGWVNSILDNVAGNTLTRTNNQFVGLYALDSNGGVFSNAKPTDTGLTGIFAYANVLNGLSAGTTNFSLSALTGNLSITGTLNSSVAGQIFVGGTSGVPAGIGPNATSVPQIPVSVSGATALQYQGVPIDATNPSTLLSTDRTNYLNWTSGTALALPAIATNFASNFPFVIKNTSTTLTITPNAGNSDLIDGAASGTLIPNFAAFVYQDSTSSPGHWFTIKYPTFAAFGSSGNVCGWSTTTGIACSNAIVNGTTATTQTAASNDTKLATDAYVDGHFIANGTAAMGTSAISSGTCASAVTVSATGVATTDVISFTPNADPTGVTGYAVSASGSLYIQAYPTANNVNFKVCNNTSGSLTPSALTLNWKVTR